MIRKLFLMLAMSALVACSNNRLDTSMFPPAVQEEVFSLADRVEGCVRRTTLDQLKRGTVVGCPDINVQSGLDGSFERVILTSDGWEIYVRVLVSGTSMIAWVDRCARFAASSKHSCKKPANPTDESIRRNAIIGTYLACGRQNTSRNERQVAARLAQLLGGYTNAQLNFAAGINSLPVDCYPLGIKQFGTFNEIGVARTKDGLAIIWSRVISGTLYQIYATPISRAEFVRLYSSRLPIAIDGLLLRGSLPNSNLLLF